MRFAQALWVSLMVAGLSVSAAASAGLFSAGNLQECLIDELYGASNDAIAGEILSKCARKYGESGPIEKKHGIFAAYHSGSECTLAKARETPSQLAARVLQANCYLVYEPSPEFDRNSAVLAEPRK
jgi:hypothetical protein